MIDFKRKEKKKKKVGDCKSGRVFLGVGIVLRGFKGFGFVLRGLYDDLSLKCLKTL